MAIEIQGVEVDEVYRLGDLEIRRDSSGWYWVNHDPSEWDASVLRYDTAQDAAWALDRTLGRG